MKQSTGAVMRCLCQLTNQTKYPRQFGGHKMEPSPVMLSRSMTTTEIWHIISSNRELKTSHLIQSTTPIRTLNFWLLDESSRLHGLYRTNLGRDALQVHSSRHRYFAHTDSMVSNP